jgi:hypothetical protein
LQLYRPLEFLLAVSAFATIAENLLPPLIAFEKEAVRQVVRNLLSLTYVIAFTQVLFNIKKRIVKERLWKAETEGAPHLVSQLTISFEEAHCMYCTVFFALVSLAS